MEKPYSKCSGIHRFPSPPQISRARVFPVCGLSSEGRSGRPFLSHFLIYTFETVFVYNCSQGLVDN